MNNRKLILYISMSLDGFIATKDDDISWLSMVEKEGEDYGYTEFSESVDTYIVGRQTYDVVLNLTGGVFPQAEKYKCYVLTRQSLENKDGVIFYNGNIEDLVHRLKSENGKNIYCDGGGQIVKHLMELNLIDDFIISIIPIVLGSGKRLFIGDTERMPLNLKSVKKHETGLVQIHYDIKL